MASPEDKTKQLYQGQIGRAYHEGKRSIPEVAFPWMCRWRARKIAPHIRGNDRVLEYGAGYGWNLAALNCAERIAYDVGEFLAPGVRQHQIRWVADSEEIANGSVDVVICHHTLEHVLDPASVLRIIHRMLRVSGKLLLFVPYERERKFRRYDAQERNHHLFSWNPQTLARLAEESGFIVQEAGLGRFGQERFAANWAARLGIGEPGFRFLRLAANLAKGEREVRVVALKG